MQKPNLISYLNLFLLAAIWGSAFFNYKIVLRNYDYFILAGGRLLFATFFFIFLSIIFFRKIKLMNFFSKDFYLFFFIGLFNYVIPFIFIGIGISNMSSGLAALLMSAGPFYAIILSHYFTDDKFNKFKFIGVCLGFFSVIILVYDNIYLTKTTNFISVIFVLMASFFYVLGGLLIKKLIINYNNETIISFSIIWATLIISPLVFLFSKIEYDKPLHLESIFSLIYLGIVSTAIAFFVRAKIIEQNGLIFMSQVSLLIPIFGIFFSYFFLSEKLYLSMAISLIFIILGLLLVQRGYKN